MILMESFLGVLVVSVLLCLQQKIGIETAAGFLFSILSVVVPVVAIILLIAAIGGLYYTGRKVVRRFFSRGPAPQID